MLSPSVLVTSTAESTTKKGGICKKQLKREKFFCTNDTTWLVDDTCDYEKECNRKDQKRCGCVWRHQSEKGQRPTSFGAQRGMCGPKREATAHPRSTHPHHVASTSECGADGELDVGASNRHHTPSSPSPFLMSTCTTHRNTHKRRSNSATKGRTHTLT